MNLTQQQNEALLALQQFILDPNKNAFILEGYAGTGKTTLLQYFINNSLPKLETTLTALAPATYISKKVEITATTNKAANILQTLFPNRICRTIHSTLKLTVKNNKTLTSRNVFITNSIVIIDECSMINSVLFEHIKNILLKKENNNKVIFVGDSTQLPPVKEDYSIVFKQNYPKFKLTNLIRQTNNSLVSLNNKLRNSVENTSLIDSININNVDIIHLNKKDFLNEIQNNMSSSDWTYNTSKYIGYTNNEVVKINNKIKEYVKGSPKVCAGDYLINNTYYINSNIKVATDEIVFIQSARDIKLFNKYDVTQVTIKNFVFHVPKKLSDIKKIKKEPMYLNSRIIHLLDLRPMYACTVHKAQGSTFETVFIDINDLKKSIKNLDMFLRLLYVAVSRASKKVVFTGDF